MTCKKKAIIFPVGSFEQHSQFGTMATDSIIASEIGRLIGDKLDVPVIPCLPFGRSKVHKSFFGTIYLNDETMINVIVDIIRSLKFSGISNIIIINGHGGNIPIFKEVYKRCDNIHFYEFSWWELTARDYFSKDDCSHAGSQEISVLSAISSNLLRHHKVKDMIPNPSFTGSSFYDIKDVTLNGVLGRATNYNQEIGTQIIQEVVEIICNEMEGVFRNDNQGKI